MTTNENKKQVLGATEQSELSYTDGGIARYHNLLGNIYQRWTSANPVTQQFYSQLSTQQKCIPMFPLQTKNSTHKKRY